MSEDFEFKPLTEGLGFHKKVIELKDEPQGPMQSAPSIHPPVSYPIKPQPQPQPAHQPQPAQQPGERLVPVAGKPLGWSPALPHASFDETKTRAPRLEPVLTAWPSAIFDATMVLGMALIFSAVVFAVTKIDIANLIEMITTDNAALAATIVLMISVFEIYTVACRSFFGKTLGEWAFDYRLGTADAQGEVTYPLKVAWRSLLIALTGFIVMPIINMITKRDITGSLTGVSLFMEKR